VGRALFVKPGAELKKLMADPHSQWARVTRAAGATEAQLRLAGAEVEVLALDSSDMTVQCQAKAANRKAWFTSELLTAIAPALPPTQPEYSLELFQDANGNLVDVDGNICDDYGNVLKAGAYGAGNAKKNSNRDWFAGAYRTNAGKKYLITARCKICLLTYANAFPSDANN